MFFGLAINKMLF